MGPTPSARPWERYGVAGIALHPAGLDERPPVRDLPGAPDDVGKNLLAFSGVYAALLGHLRDAWSPGGTPDDLGAAIGRMADLGSYAKDLMAQPIPGGGGSYGSDFVIRTA
jgi:hypothetical protein